MPRPRLRSRAETARISMALPQRRARSWPCVCSSFTVPAPTLPTPAMAMRRGRVMTAGSAVEEDLDAPVARFAGRQELVEERRLGTHRRDGDGALRGTHADQGAADGIRAGL